jgi:hypothetical protein
MVDFLSICVGYVSDEHEQTEDSRIELRLCESPGLVSTAFMTFYFV